MESTTYLIPPLPQCLAVHPREREQCGRPAGHITPHGWWSESEQKYHEWPLTVATEVRR